MTGRNNRGLLVRQLSIWVIPTKKPCSEVGFSGGGEVLG